ncbi:flagellar biosynthesis protein FlgJ [Phyllobacterium salinisoli]|uniref:Flagellar biosynthesis protein FlgJ n=1 Tax=Phyllobacterium salinisoli TaxID=1899321 RepID=A0A368K3P2_9HYPH|nr:rod-binding protein [Phyllobacterium salinisoli]RCS23997.1 flagellar biosynthesis protein FlgJ [Phyllobacterium salinisoli]
MAINPPSDIVLDVATAADPEKFRASVERLRTLASSRVSSGASGGPSFAQEAFSVGAAPSGKTVSTSAEHNPAYTKFEAFMLQSFVQSMFTDDTNAVFGQGISGEYWKSMMAEAIAQKMADGGGIGIARMLEAQSKRLADANMPVTASLMNVKSQEAAAGETGSLSTDILHQAERQLIKQQLNNTDADAGENPHRS